MAITLDGTNGITTPDLDTDGLTVDTNTLFVDAANNRVGIGTSSPSQKLDVVGTGNTTARIGADGSSETALHFGNTTIGRVSVRSAAPLAFETGAVERARITSGGQVLMLRTTAYNDGNVGTPTLQVNGIVGALAAAAFIADTTGSINIVGFVNPNGTVGTINISGTSTSYVTSSDYRLKENVVPLAGAADRLSQIPVHRFNFIADPNTTVDGFLAHEVQEFVPEAITGTKDEVDDEGNPKYQGIDQSKLVPLLTAALQEALQKIDDLTARISALETSA